LTCARRPPPRLAALGASPCTGPAGHPPPHSDGAAAWASWSQADHDAWVERAAILEYDAGLPRPAADLVAYDMETERHWRALTGPALRQP
jgi:hypothetical protein